jgi:hypothetical protein
MGDVVAGTTIAQRHAMARSRVLALFVYGAGVTGLAASHTGSTTTQSESPTGSGLSALNWRSAGRTSTVDPDWFMPWYFNFGNRDGLALHTYSLPGHPASHGCIRLLERDAQWLFDWGDTWVLDATGTRVLQRGTPILIIGEYDFNAPPPWRSPNWLSQRVELPSAALTDVAKPR